VLAACAAWLVAAPAAGASSSPLDSAGIPHPPHRLGTAAVPHATGPDYPGALWEPASPANYTVADRPESNPIQRIVIHVAQGGFASTYEWFRNPAAQASAHYLVSQTGQVAQMVPERDIAWHAGNWAYNETSIGIEHAGYTQLGDFTQPEYLASAHLSAYLVRKYTIVPDRTHVIGHYQVPDPDHPGEFGGIDHHTDPGPYWKWPMYMGFIRLYANVTYGQTLDDSTPGQFRSAAGWYVSHARRGYTGSGYHYAVASRTLADPVSYRLITPETDGYDVFMRWPCNAGYNRDVTVGFATTTGYHAAHVDESRNCERWNYVGTYTFAAGDGYRMVILRSSPYPGNIAADAVRLVETRDLVPPAMGGSPTVTATTRTSVSLGWPAASDNVEVAGYRLWANGLATGHVATAAATIGGLRCNWGYTFWVRAYDGFWNLAPEPATVRVMTAACPAPPTAVTATASPTAGDATLGWRGSPDANAGYAIWVDGVRTGTAAAGATSYPITGLSCGADHTLGVQSLASDGTVSTVATTDLQPTC
jgi:hypothetical protein